MTLLGVDTGGTFTDFVLLEDRRMRVHKVLSTPHAPEAAILQGISELGIETDLRLVHGSTVATNAVLEGKGATTAFITNRGLKDLLTLGRQTRQDLYALQPPPVSPPVSRPWCLETGGRLSADGSLVEPLTEADLAHLRTALAALAPQAVAINLLFSFLDDRLERTIEAAMPADTFVARSSAILPEYREYERGMTTWLNAYVGPIVQGYLSRLQQALPETAIAVMQSAGGTMAAEQASQQAVHMLLSGPAGGLAGARFVGASTGREQLLTFDMGGTSTDVALIDGDLQLTTEGHIGPYPVGIPMVDMHTIGAGGGSIASIDAGGLLRVGPGSAGADPGPACYGRGGQAPTVTDANLVLGRLRPEAFLGGHMALDIDAAHQALAIIGKPLGLSVEAAAQGVVELANEHMARALRIISVQRGLDPRAFTLTSFGGAGGLHVCALADKLAMTEALVPVHAGVLSALGMLVAPRARQLSQTIGKSMDTVEVGQVTATFNSLEASGRQALHTEGVADAAITAQWSVDARYRGQSYTLNVPWTDPAGATQAFQEAHKQRFGHRLALPVELVNARVAVTGPTPDVALAAIAPRPAAPVAQARLHGVSAPVAVYRRQDLGAGACVVGPALITEAVASTYLAPHWRCQVDSHGNLLLQRANSAAA